MIINTRGIAENEARYSSDLFIWVVIIAGLVFPDFSWAAPRIEALTLDLPYVGRYHVGGFSEDVETLAGMRMGVSFSETWGMEFYDIGGDSNKSNNGQERYGHLIRLEGDRHFHYGKWIPFLAFGGGGIKLQPHGGGHFIPVLDYGGGLKYFFGSPKSL